ncbi:MAG: two-component system, chemotaxis family, chemotaxis protein CheY [Blastocatellia bacterium]
MGHKLLIVEDNAPVREMFALALSEAGFSVITAEDGCAGLDRARRERPDLILTDLEMPNLDGIQMIQCLRQEPELQGIPVLVLSAVHTGMLMQAVAAGACEVMQKPVQLMSLIEIVRQILAARLADNDPARKAHLRHNLI